MIHPCKIPKPSSLKEWIYSTGILSGLHNRHFNSADIHHANELTDLAEWYVTDRLPHGLLKYVIWKE